MGTHWKRLAKELPMSTHNICFCGEIRKISAFFGLKKVPYLLLCNFTQHAKPAANEWLLVCLLKESSKFEFTALHNTHIKKLFLSFLLKAGPGLSTGQCGRSHHGDQCWDKRGVSVSHVHEGPGYRLTTTVTFWRGSQYWRQGCV